MPIKPVKIKNASKPHRRKAHWVNGYWMRRTKNAFRIGPHSRYRRRSKIEIALKGTRKQERKKKRDALVIKQIQRQKKGTKLMKKTRQTRFGKPKGPPKIK